MVIDRSKHMTFLHSGPEGSQKEGVEHQTLVFSDGEHVEVHNKQNEVCHFVLIGGQPLNEPIVQYGRFIIQ